MNYQINAKVNSLKNYLDKEPLAAKEMALHFYRCYLELGRETAIIESIAATLIEQNSQPPSLPSFCSWTSNPIDNGNTR